MNSKSVSLYCSFIDRLPLYASLGSTGFSTKRLPLFYKKYIDCLWGMLNSYVGGKSVCSYSALVGYFWMYLQVNVVKETTASLGIASQRFSSYLFKRNTTIKVVIP